MRPAPRIDELAESAFNRYGFSTAISLTNRCPLRCAHCIADSGPERDDHADLGASVIDGFIDDLPNLAGRVDIVTLTGGEATLMPTEVNRIARECDSHGIAVALMTSAFWAKKLEPGRRFFGRLGPIGYMTVSTDLEHLRFVPFEWVENAVLIGEEHEVVTSVRLTVADRETAEESALKDKVLRAFGEKVEIQSLVPWGRGESYGPAQVKLGLLHDIPTLPCPSSGPHILETGEVIPCCNTLTGLKPNHSLVMGDAKHKPLSEILESSNHDPLLLYIRLFGFSPILAFLRTSGIELSNDDVSPCHVCALIMQNKESSTMARRFAEMPEQLVHICAVLKSLKQDIDLEKVVHRH